MESIPCTAYFPTLEKTVGGAVQVSADHWRKAQPIIEAGLVFEVEHLTTGEVSATITDPGEGDLHIRVFANLPGNLRRAFAEMIDEYHAKEES